ncbi:hypothetical protein ACP4OV_019972 [Aristida adscensionis]
MRILRRVHEIERRLRCYLSELLSSAFGWAVQFIELKLTYFIRRRKPRRNRYLWRRFRHEYPLQPAPSKTAPTSSRGRKQRLRSPEHYLPNYRLDLVIFTTRNQAIYDKMGCDSNTTIQLRCLGEEDASILFRDKVGDEIIEAHPQIKYFAKKMVAECRGLPSSLCTIGRAMCPPPRLSYVPVAKIISSLLKEESFLLVLDDMRETLDLATVGLPMPLGHRQKVIFTARNQAICNKMGCDSNTTIQLRCLGEEDASILFRDKVGDEIIEAHPQIKHFAKKMVAECRGLPSSLCTIGRAMCTKRDVKEWRNAYDLLKMKRPPNEIQEETSNQREQDIDDAIFINLGLGPPPRLSDVPVAKIISSLLKEESFLLLLDDMRETLDLAAVGLPMPLGHRQKVIFTTRNQAICDKMGCDSNSTIHLQCLEEEDAWSLFREKVGDEIIHAHPQIKHLAKKIVAKCGGLPRTLCTVGRYMSSKRNVKECRNAYDLLRFRS